MSLPILNLADFKITKFVCLRPKVCLKHFHQKIREVHKTVNSPSYVSVFRMFADKILHGSGFSMSKFFKEKSNDFVSYEEKN